ncbi:protein broad-minded-like isoform X2 [Ceratina calcarata]|uniref:Protein broad-minded-like isoform X2 n=1 Tax=Ceratina calcarata TaxID=156304 RepID=A0AAJ7NAR9_9HYME|nr:protein broad-minded-like isoform X2 [Ceratina calcarata]
MDDNISGNLQKWIKKCLKKEFQSNIEKFLEEDMNNADIVDKMIHSKEMSALVNSMRTTIVEQSVSRSVSTSVFDSRPQSSFSCISDQTSEDWNSPLNNEEYYNVILDKISQDKPAHVRLAGYEIFLKSELSNLNNNPIWDSLQSALLAGLTDDSRPIFEASLQVHAKLLTCLQSHDVYSNLLTAFDAQYHSQKTFEILPTLIAGINFKFFLHERVFRIIHLMLRYHEEKLKTARNPDKTIEELIEQFITFLSTHEFANTTQPKAMNILNIVSVLEPRADWSRKWIVSLATRRMFLTALGKSPTLLQQIMHHVQKGLAEPPHSMSVSIYDDPMEVIINGNTVKTVTYLHCLCFVSQLCAYEAGRKLLTENTFEVPFSIPEFLTACLRGLNKLSTETLTGVHEVSCYALQFILDKPTILYDNEFYHIALCHLQSLSENNVRIWPHTLNIILHMLDTVDGSRFLISQCKEHTVNFEKSLSKCPAMFIIIIASNTLRQPFSIMNLEYLLKLFEVIQKLFDVFDVYEIVQLKVEREFYPAVSYFYKKLDKSYLENENKAQQINSAVNALLLKMVSIPFGLKALVQQTTVFQELIEGSVTPLRTSWTSIEVVNFVTSAASFQLGYNVIANLASHVLSTLLSDACQILEDPCHFHDPWDHENIQKLLQTLTLFSLNFKCFSAFMTNVKDSYNEEQNYPLNLPKLFNDSVNPESNYHYLGLLSLNAVISNLNVCLYLLELLNFQNILLEFQQFDAKEDGEMSVKYIDDYTLIRHKILSKTYFVNIKNEEEETSKSEEYDLPMLPPPKFDNENVPLEDEYETELEYSLRADTPGLLDSDWVEQIREAYKASQEPTKNTVLIQLLDKMHKAIPTSEWGEHFEWEENVSSSTDSWFTEEIHGIDFVLYYAEQNDILNNTTENKERLQEFINACYAFIQYERPKKFDGFDWFLSTVFIICEGNIERCKTFITQLIQFPITMFLWPNLGKVVDKYTREECGIQFTFMQLLESIVSTELAHTKFALKSTSGMNWSLICNSMVLQCFWGFLPWSEIKHFIAVCVLFSPDYIIYYCASLLNHCQRAIMENVTARRIWPDYIDFEDYRCHHYFKFMDMLDKRYGNKILPKFALKGFS